MALANATHFTRAVVDQTDFPVRARLLAGEIARAKPDLVGLQEVALWRSGPLELTNVGVANAETVDYDFLAILLEGAAVRGAHYVRQMWDCAPTLRRRVHRQPVQRNHRRRSARRADDHARRGPGAGARRGEGGRWRGRIYAYNLSVDIAGDASSFDRGYQWVDVRSGRDRFRFVNTHLEAFSSDLALAQATELLSVAAPDGRTSCWSATATQTRSTTRSSPSTPCPTARRTS